jgi:RNA polymerase sigma-70 factor (ECF subfamily)
MSSVTGSAEAAFRRHYGDVYRYLRRRTRDHHEAEELAQRVFADAAASLDGAETPLAWLYAVARRRFADASRRSGRTVELGEVAAAELVHGPATARAIRAALARVPAEQRAVIVAKLLEGRSFAEIARRTGATEAACKMRFLRGLRTLRTLLEQEGIEP